MSRDRPPVAASHTQRTLRQNPRAAAADLEAQPRQFCLLLQLLPFPDPMKMRSLLELGLLLACLSDRSSANPNGLGRLPPLGWCARSIGQPSAKRYRPTAIAATAAPRSQSGTSQRPGPQHTVPRDQTTRPLVLLSQRMCRLTPAPLLHPALLQEHVVYLRGLRPAAAPVVHRRPARQLQRGARQVRRHGHALERDERGGLQPDQPG